MTPQQFLCSGNSAIRKNEGAAHLNISHLHFSFLTSHFSFILQAGLTLMPPYLSGTIRHTGGHRHSARDATTHLPR